MTMIDVGATDRTKGTAAAAMRPTLAGLRHMISAGHYLAANAGFQILEAGGNAIDAGVAAGITLGVVQSDFVNFAGVAPILIYLAEEKKVVSISGLGWWPRAANLDHYLKAFGGRIPVGLPRTVVPAAPDAWITALQRYGTMTFADVASSAIRLADDGFVMYPLMAEMIENNKAGYERWASSREIYLPGGKPPKVGDIFRQRDLAKTLRYLADQERAASAGGRDAGLRAARDAFYKGDIARTIVAYHEQNGGFLSMQDFADFSVEIEPALRTAFHETEVYSCGFWCQGPSLLQMINMAEARDVGSLVHNSPDYIHFIAETIKLTFADRAAHFGDPRHVDVPGDTLLSKAYAAQRIREIDPDRAIRGLPASGLSVKAPRALPRKTEQTDGVDPTLDTSYVAVIDRHGNAFSATPSDASNNMPVIPGTGLCPSSRGSQSWAIPGHPATIAPGRRPRLTPNPSLAIAPGGSVMPFGTPGGDVQTQAMLQVFLNVSVFGMDLQTAVEAPRFASFSYESSFEPHEIQLDKLMVEEPINAAAVAALCAKGHDAQSWPMMNWRAGSVCAVRHDVATGVRTAGADPRRPSYAVGW